MPSLIMHSYLQSSSYTSIDLHLQGIHLRKCKEPSVTDPNGCCEVPEALPGLLP